MQFNLYHWLFDDAYTAGTSGGLSGSEPFRYFWPFVIFCCAGMLIAFYYSVEGRKRFVKNKPLLKYMFDRYLGWLAVICFIGIPVALARVSLDQYFFSWRLWRYLWLIGMIAWAITWVTYLVRKYPEERANYIAYQKQQRYVSKGNRRKVKAAAR